MANTSTPDERQEVGAVLGRVLYHSLRGECFDSQILPAESFFLDYILSYLGSENFTIEGKHPSCNVEVFLCHKLKLLDQQLNPAVVFHNSLFLLLLLFPADLEVLMARLNIGPSHGHDHEDNHQHRAHDHTHHDHTGLRLKKRSSPEHHMEREGNSSWDQVR